MNQKCSKCGNDTAICQVCGYAICPRCSASAPLSNLREPLPMKEDWKERKKGEEVRGNVCNWCLPHLHHLAAELGEQRLAGDIEREIWLVHAGHAFCQAIYTRYVEPAISALEQNWLPGDGYAVEIARFERGGVKGKLSIELYTSPKLRVNGIAKPGYTAWASRDGKEWSHRAITEEQALEMLRQIEGI